MATVRVAVASTNKAKVDATQIAFSKYFPDLRISSVQVDSGVHQQPMKKDILRGADNRAHALLRNGNGHDFYVGIEGGLTRFFGKWFQEDIVCIINRSGGVHYGKSSAFELPPSIVGELRKGRELSEVIDEMLKRKDTREQGVVSYLSSGRLNKAQHLSEGVHMALLPFLNPHLFNRKSFAPAEPKPGLL
jgi:inosine/xanthosine triphosphatase